MPEFFTGIGAFWRGPIKALGVKPAIAVGYVDVFAMIAVDF
ncbi:MAG: hypothetical protein ACKVLA_15150 [Rhodobacterales bacterium]